MQVQAGANFTFSLRNSMSPQVNRTVNKQFLILALLALSSQRCKLPATFFHPRDQQIAFSPTNRHLTNDTTAPSRLPRSDFIPSPSNGKGRAASRRCLGSRTNLLPVAARSLSQYRLIDHVSPTVQARYEAIGKKHIAENHGNS